ncbi:Serine protease EspC (plasmid) [Escherichia coli]|uniref:autotransporter outer membrane beta-barrel domain-containing protein n=4 Tax=Enterobacteriaceae TaxID=543 RepID=UPI0016609A8F|nr:autotransporter outer membrane beta-barrel domain-containing protein [Escherichia coli]EFN6682711.1 autotransporter outer membrane beta-barrel domain-containing protein [Escherichia coli O179:H8]EFN6749703.1 autotransporter outer membrane beta-barrel domain-containing protein [Escherichia coli O179:H8]QNS35988.1 Serine protease EspC [Escherichia coli]HBA8126715.1 autotransporter outer membrane beta-barrel domain-containing protein [Escherichia coli]
MNKIYSLKYCPVTQGLIAVSELASRVSSKTGRKLLATLIVSALSYGAAEHACAAQMDTRNFWIRDYLDLAQNKGAFQAGAFGVKTPLKNGGEFSFPEVTIPDFSPVSAKGATTAIGNAYSVTASHNGTIHHAIHTQTWGQSDYHYVDRVTKGDFAVQRLDKFVVETAGATEHVDFGLSATEALERYGVEFNGKKQIIGFRVGSGATGVTSYRVGQAYNPLLRSASMFQLDWKSMHANNNTGGFHNETTGGDSGSGFYLYDNKNKKWVILGTLTGIVYSNNWQRSIFARYDQSTVDNLKSIFTQDISLNNQNMTINNKNMAVNGKTTAIELTRSNKNKDLSFHGGGTIELTDNLNSGTGGMIFDEGQHYSVTGKDKTYKGAGIDIGKGTVVDWSVKGVANDNLHKTGAGTLNVNVAQGNNLKTGDGTVFLNAEKAFNAIYVASGRGTVKLGQVDALDKNSDYRGIYFTSRGGTLDLNGFSQSFKKIAATDVGTVITNTSDKKATLSLQNASRYIYHGNITGNTDIEHAGTQKNADSSLIIDGNIDTHNDITVRNSQLRLQGHATTHAIFREGPRFCYVPGVLCDKDYVADFARLESEANKKNNSEYKTNNQVSSFDQPDWENRHFRFKTLNLDNAEFTTARNSIVEGDIVASDSSLKLGGDVPVFIDKYDGINITGNGFGFRQDVREGRSADDGSSSYTGNITLNNNSTLDINSRFTGGIEAHDSQVNVTSPDALLQNSGVFVNSSLSVHDGGHLTAQKGLYSDGRVQIGKNGTLSLSGTPEAGADNRYMPVLAYNAKGYDLTGNNATLDISQQAHVSGDVHATSPSNIRIGSENPGSVSSSVSPVLAAGIFSGYNAAYYGAITGGKGNVSMNNGLWQLTGDSGINSLTARNSRVQSEEKGAFRTLTVNTLDATGSDFVLRTDLKNADKISVTGKASGSDNTLNVSFMKNPTPGQSLNIPLVTAPAGTATEVFKAGTRVTGFSRVTPTLHVDTTGGSTKWILDGFRTEADKAAAAKADSFMNAGYKNFMTEVNNLNKRMGELRDMNGDAGAWARIMNGAGSADGGYSDNYTHVQVGFDKKHALDGVDLFTGVTMTYTDSSADSDAFSGKTKSVGGGLYASALFNSGAYIDLIGKYIHHNNDYTGNFAGLGTKHYGTHSWYAGAETGYRYHLTEDTFIEPQAELVYGAVSGKTFRWKDGEMDLSMKNKDFSPLIGRTGIELGKTFSGKDWSVTARAGTSWQFDLLNNGETVLRDASGEKRIKGEKDSRMLFNVGMNAQIKDNMRFGLEFEKSAFGKYNVDNAINANFRYMF